MDNVVKFPDAPTQRGVKHIEELIQCKKQGFDAFILFVVQLSDVDYFTPNMDTYLERREVLEKELQAYAEEISPKFNLLAFTTQVSWKHICSQLRNSIDIQDSYFDVRTRFLSKLIVLLHARKLPPKYNLILFLTVHDPVEDVKQKV